MYRHPKILMVVLVAAGLAGIFSASTAAESPESSGWIDGAITVTKLRDHTWTEHDQYLYGNIPCTYTDGYIWGTQTNGWNTWNSKAVDTECATMGTSAYIGSERIMPFGSEYWQLLDKNDIYDSALFSNPATNGLAVVQPAYYNYNRPHELHYVSDVLATFNALSKDNAGNIVRSQGKPYDHTLAYSNGQPVGVTSLSGVSYSANGKWMYVLTSAGQLRINTEDFSVLSFAPYFSATYGTYTSISNSGNTIVRHTFDRDGLILYDLTRCAAERPDYASRDCASRNITDLVIEEFKKTLPDASKLGWPVGFSEVKFMNESEIRLLVQYAYDGQPKAAFFSLKLDTTEPPMRYLALGDSFSSGEGTFDYIGETNFFENDNEYNLCHLSSVSYPYLLSRILPISSWVGSVACSGAETSNILNNTQNGGLNYIKSAAQALHASMDDTFLNGTLNDLKPGYLQQYAFVSAKQPTVATMTIGGNDIGFGDIVKTCITQFGCFSNREKREKKADEIASKILGMSTKLRTIRESMASSNPKLYVLGYPSIVNFAGISCSLIGQEERERLSAMEDYLNESIKIAAHNAGAIYVDMTSTFAESTDDDYRICGNASPAVNGFVPVGDARSRQSVVRPGNIYGAESYHPNEFGYQLLAAKIRTLTNDFQFSPTVTAYSQAKPDDSFYRRFVGDSEDLVSVSATYAFMTQYDSIQRGDSLDMRIKQSSTLLPSMNGQAVVELHSTPVTLTTIDFDPTSENSALVTIPSTVEPGWHELHVLYMDIEGKQVDLYQYLYVIASADDYDGDGVPNDDEACPIGGTLGIDEDKDGVDDACDPQIKKSEDTTAPMPDNPSTTGGSNSGLSTSKELTNPVVVATVFRHEQELTNTAATTLPVTIGDNAIFKNSSSATTSGVKQSIHESGDSINLFGWLVILLGLVVIVLSSIFILRKRRT